VANDQKTIVISDIHMSNGKNYSWFTAAYADKLAKMLNAVAEKKGRFEKVNELVALGDLFDLWLYPVNEAPWTVEKILGKNPLIKEALQACVANIPHVYYLNGNHDMDVTDDDLRLLSAGGNEIQRISTADYRKLHPTRHLEHGHAADLFNAPDDSGDALGGYPLGYFITRLVATAENQNKVYRRLRKLYRKLNEMFSKIHWAVAPTKPAEPQDAFAPQALAVSSIGSVMVVKLIIGLLSEFAPVRSDTVIKVSDEILKNRFQGKQPKVGDIQSNYRRLCRRWYELKGFNNLLEAMLATETLDWHAAEVLAADPALKVVVMGHTHASVLAPRYNNDGCWCDSSVFGHSAVGPTYVEIVGDHPQTVFWRPGAAAWDTL
jgi:UDP-2,3-diacylglucosamine pyrophosphatase LpxH